MTVPLLAHPNDYLFNLLAMRSSDAKKMHREAILEKWNYNCCYCAAHFPASELTLDHVRPRSRGGSSFTNNLVPSCTACNRAKGTQHWLDWMRSTFGPAPSREQLILNWIHI
jgi:hypothetical protein